MLRSFQHWSHLGQLIARLPKYKERPHLYKKWFWAALAIPTALWWSESILWVLMISLYANFVGEDSADEAQQAKLEARENAKNSNPED